MKNTGKVKRSSTKWIFQPIFERLFSHFQIFLMILLVCFQYQNGFSRYGDLIL